MYQPTFHKKEALRFKHFSRKGYALFSVLGREVLIGTLSVATLSHAKASGVSTRLDLAGDSVMHQGIRLDEVEVTGTRAPLSAMQSVRVVGVITRDEIARAGATTINDLLKQTVNVDVRQRGGFGMQTDISMNGGTFDQITILLNGVDISNPQTGHNTAFFPVALQDIERIEVLEGAASRVFGSQAFCGAINIVTRRGGQAQAMANLEGGSYGSAGGSATLTGGWGKNGVQQGGLLSGGYHRSDGGTENSDFERWHGFGNYEAAFGQHVTIGGQLGINHQRYGANTFYSAKYNNQYENTTNLTSALKASFHAADRHWEVAPTVYANRWLDHYQLIRGMAGAKAGENYHQVTVVGGGVNAYLNSLLGKTAVGFDLRRETIYSTAYGDELPEDKQKTIAGSDRLYSRKAGRTNTNIYMEHNVLLGRFTLSAGVLANTNTALDDAKLSLYPGVDAAYRIDEHWKVFGSWNMALRMPTYTDLYTNNVVQQGDVHLKPEKKTEGRVGARFADRWMELTVQGFASHGKDMIDWVFATDKDTRYHALNIGKLDNLGASMDAQFNLRSLWNNGFLDRFRLGYAYIHQQHETDQPIFKSLYALEYLRHKVTLGLDHHLWGKLSASWNARWQQRMNGYKPYWKLDGKLMWKEQRWDAYVLADNLTGHRYYDYGAVRQPGLWVMAGVNLHINM